MGNFGGPSQKGVIVVLRIWASDWQLLFVTSRGSNRNVFCDCRDLFLIICAALHRPTQLSEEGAGLHTAEAIWIYVGRHLTQNTRTARRPRRRVALYTPGVGQCGNDTAALPTRTRTCGKFPARTDHPQNPRRKRKREPVNSNSQDIFHLSGPI
jgi:hypothetical protein